MKIKKNDKAKRVVTKRITIKSHTKKKMEDEIVKKLQFQKSSKTK
jgi:hypothetical protein